MKPKETYDCHYISKPIKVDGLLDEPQWQRAGHLCKDKAGHLPQCKGTTWKTKTTIRSQKKT